MCGVSAPGLPFALAACAGWPSLGCAFAGDRVFGMVVLCRASEFRPVPSRGCLKGVYGRGRQRSRAR